MRVRPFLAALFAFVLTSACADRSQPIASGDMTDALPAERINQVLGLQSGLTIRGGRPDQAVTYVDGVPVQAGNSGNAYAGYAPVAPNGFQEATITTGASAAAYGNAQSGVISIDSRQHPGSIDTPSLPAMLIRTGYAQVRVDSLEPAIATLEALARQSGGYVGNTSFTGGEERRRAATLQIRVPSARFGDLQVGLSSVGKVLGLSVSVQDVGEEFTDATARLKSKRQVEARLLDLLRTRVGKLSDVVELEQALEDAREEIESTEGRLRYLRSQVGLSTMTVTLTEPGLQIQEPGYHPIRDAFGAAWRNFTHFIASLIAATGWLVPLALLLIAGGRGLVWVWRKRKNG